VQFELLGDVSVEGGDGGDQRAQHPHQGERDPGLGIGGGSSTSRRAIQAVHEHFRGHAAAVRVGAQPGGQTLGGQPACLVGTGEALQEAQADVTVEVAEEADRAREDQQEVGAELIGGGHPRGHQILAGAHRSSERECCRRVRFEGWPAMTVGAQAFGEHVGVAAIVLVARQAKARAQRLDNTTAHHDHLQPNRHQRVHDRAIWSLDRDTARPGACKAIAQLAEPSGAVGHRKLVEPASRVIGDARAMLGARPIDSAESACAMLHNCLLAVTPVGKHPVVPGRGSWLLTDRRSESLSPKASQHVPGHRSSRNSYWPSGGEPSRRWTGGYQGSSRTGEPSGTERVHQ